VKVGIARPVHHSIAHRRRNVNPVSHLLMLAVPRKMDFVPIAPGKFLTGCVPDGDRRRN
jgi:hypothetical protein